MHLRLLLLALVLTLVGCTATTPSAPPSPPELVRPAAGRAVIYFFRPAADRTGLSTRPVLLLNQAPVAQLAHSTYTYMELPPGDFRFDLKPGENDSSEWQSAARICIQPDKVYYVAVWNQSQPLRTTTVVLPIGGAFLPIPITTSSRGSVRFEPVDASIGVEALSGLLKVPFTAPREGSLPFAQGCALAP